MENLILQKCCGNATAPARAGGGSFKEELLRPFIVKIDAHMSASGRTDAAFGAFEVLGSGIAAWLSLHPAALAHIWDWGEVRGSAWPSGSRSQTGFGAASCCVYLFIYSN